MCFIARLNLKNMKDTLDKKRLLEQGNHKILHWSVWMDGFDFTIENLALKKVELYFKMLNKEPKECSSCKEKWLEEV